MDFLIRQATDPLDRAQAEDLRRSVLCGELDWPWEVVRDEADLPAAGGVVALAWLGQKPVGTGRLARRDPDWCLEVMAVLPAFRRMGAGCQLVAFLEAMAAARGAQALRLICPPSAFSFFQRLAYKDMKGGDDLDLPIGWHALEKTLPAPGGPLAGH